MPHLDHDRLRRHRQRNFWHSALILVGMGGLLMLIGSTFLGLGGLVIAFVACGLLVAFGQRISPEWILRHHHGRPLGPRQAPQLYDMVHELARRAELRRPPRLWWIPSAQPNAFAVGSVESSAIGVTEGLLRRLSAREIAGVLAHEVSHIRHRDLWLMSLADLLSRMTRTLSLFGQLILLVTLPLVLFGRTPFSFPWLLVLLLIAAPTVSALLQLALSRTRELEADLEAVELTGDPLGLASALRKLEQRTGHWLWQILVPYRRPEEPSILRTHPVTAERVRQLESLVEAPPRVVRMPAARPLPQWDPFRTVEHLLRQL